MVHLLKIGRYYEVEISMILFPYADGIIVAKVSSYLLFYLVYISISQSQFFQFRQLIVNTPTDHGPPPPPTTPCTVPHPAALQHLLRGRHPAVRLRDGPPGRHHGSRQTTGREEQVHLREVPSSGQSQGPLLPRRQVTSGRKIQIDVVVD